MNLKEYIKHNAIIKKKFAKKMNMNIQTLDKIINGYDVKISLAEKICNETHGRVTLEDTLNWVKENKKTIEKKKVDM